MCVLAHRRPHCSFELTSSADTAGYALLRSLLLLPWGYRDVCPGVLSQMEYENGDVYVGEVCVLM